jgi:hypothetical protein
MLASFATCTDTFQYQYSHYMPQYWTAMIYMSPAERNSAWRHVHTGIQLFISNSSNSINAQHMPNAFMLCVQPKSAAGLRRLQLQTSRRSW